MALAAALFLGPLALALDQGLTYVLVKWTCAAGTANVLSGIALVAVAITVTGALCGGATVLSLQGRYGRGEAARDPRYFLAVVGIVLNVLVALLIMTALAPRQLLSPCE